MDAQRVPFLDALRFGAALMVVLYHYLYRPALASADPQSVLAYTGVWAAYGYLGVELFFMISGFVITWTALGRSPTQFVTSRVLRLYPCFWTCTCLTWLSIVALRPETHWPSLSDILINMTMIPGYLGAKYIDVVYWTLAVELKFYVVVGLLILFRQIGRLDSWIAMWSLLLLASSAGLLPNWLRMIIIADYGGFFVLGMICYLVFSTGWTLQRRVLFVVALAQCLLSTIENQPDFIGSPSFFQQTVSIVVVLAFCSCMYGVATRRIVIGPSPAIALLGALTYPLYLLHNEIGRAIVERTSSDWPMYLSILVSLAVIFVLSLAVTYLVENKCVRWLKRTRFVSRMLAASN